MATERSFNVHGRAYTYLESGPPNGWPLIAIHSLTAHAGVWNALARQLADRWRVIAPDLRGHGASAWSTDYAQQAWVDDVSAVVDELHLERFALIGNTMGSRVAWLYAAQHPDKVTKLISMDMSPRMPGPFPPIGDPTFETVDAAVEQARQEPVYLSSKDDLFREYIQRDLERRPDGRWAWRYDPAVRSAPRDHPGFSATIDEQWHAVREIACPTLVISTGRNAAIARDTREELMPALRNAELLELDTGKEDILLGRPDLLATAVRTFLER